MMAKILEAITPELAGWIQEQPLFFVATAPLAADGHVNCSPKGLDSLRILGPSEVAYVDFTGSGAETIAHVRENGRIILMFCAFSGPPKIIRLHGRGRVLPAGTPAYQELRPLFPQHPGARAIIRIAVTRVSQACGFTVPLMEYVGHRDNLVRWAKSKGEEGLATYWRQRNARSIDGLPALETAHRPSNQQLGS